MSNPVPPKAPDMTIVMKAIGMGISVLNVRLLVLLALFAAGGLGWLAVADPTVLRIIASSLFDLLVFGPLVLLQLYRG